MINNIKEELINNNDVDVNYNINGIIYDVKFLSVKKEEGINVPSIILCPIAENINNQIMLETNNLESNDFEKILKQGLYTANRLSLLTKNKPCPIIVPLLPGEQNGPYYQQLSKECFELSKTNEYYRIDEQIVRIINNTKITLKDKYNIKTKDKLFINGYSTSGVFAQRFCLLHPELIDTACIGGASGSIPLPTEHLNYPLGINDYETLFNKEFNFNEYSQIKFRYYVGEHELENKSYSSFDENNMPAPKHDMSYYIRSVSKETGMKQRELLGINMFERIDKTIEILKEMNMDIENLTISGRTHNNEYGIGVNELGDRFINDSYLESLKSIVNEKSKG